MDCSWDYTKECESLSGCFVFFPGPHMYRCKLEMVFSCFLPRVTLQWKEYRFSQLQGGDGYCPRTVIRVEMYPISILSILWRENEAQEFYLDNAWDKLLDYNYRTKFWYHSYAIHLCHTLYIFNNTIVRKNLSPRD